MLGLKKKLNKNDEEKIIESYDYIYKINVNDIKPNPNSVRRAIRYDRLDELTESVKNFGIIEPVLLRNINNKFYEIVDGERRLMAAKSAGIEYIPSVILNISDDKSAFLYLIENSKRDNLSFIEEAEGIFNIKNDYGYSEEEISSLTGLRESDIRKYLKLMDFSPESRSIIAENNISFDHCMYVLKIPDEKIRKNVLRKVVNEKYSIEKTKEEVNFEIERIKNEDIIFFEQKEKRSIADMRLFTNSVKKSIDLMNKSGIGAEYEVEKNENSTKIIISIPVI